MNVLVLAGGSSSEREVSLRSGANIEQSLRGLGHMVVTADPSGPDFNLKQLIAGIDAVFPILHGAGGEDGVLQEELEKLDVPFLGSGSKSSKLAFDKFAHKKLLVEKGILTPGWEMVDDRSFSGSQLARQPYVLKPFDGGSSVDTFIVRDPTNPPSGINRALEGHGKMLIEELIEGNELTVGVLGDESLPAILIVPPEGEEFDYENKYNGKTKEIVNPDTVSTNLQQQAQALALRVHQITGCRHFSRTDFMLSQSNQVYVLEINTIPGMTSESLFPKAAAAAGHDMNALTKKLLELTLAS
nr:D-ala D-ala ligase C-terminus [uncultured bacterium]